ncbi:hypothetical protein [Streptomyces sp. NPDC003480]
MLLAGSDEALAPYRGTHATRIVAETPQDIGQENWEDLQHALGDPRTVHVMCEDYRAGLGIDRRHDDEDRAAGRQVQCPTLVLRGTKIAGIPRW